MHELNIYLAATKLPTGDREHFIQGACAKNPQLLDRVRALFEKMAAGSGPIAVDAAPASGNTIQTRYANGILIAYLADARILDAARIDQIGSELLGLIQVCPGRKLVLNFNKVDFMSSAMLGKIIRLSNECRSAQIDLRLCEIAPKIMKVFELTKLNVALNIDRSEEKALAAFAKRGLFGSRTSAAN